MRITLNNRPEEVGRDWLTVSELLQAKNFTFRMLIVRINGIFVPKTAYDSTGIRPGDDVQVIHLISGG